MNDQSNDKPKARSAAAAENLREGALILGGGILLIVLGVVIEKVTARLTNIGIVDIPFFLLGALAILVGAAKLYLGATDSQK